MHDWRLLLQSAPCLASVVELVYTSDLKSDGFGYAGSSPATRTILLHLCTTSMRLRLFYAGMNAWLYRRERGFMLICTVVRLAAMAVDGLLFASAGVGLGIFSVLYTLVILIPSITNESVQES
jgi:hypothetical protein